MWFLLICSLLSYLKLHEIFVFFKSPEELEADQHKVMKQITKCTKSFGKCTLEQTATLRAWSEKNHLPVDKHRIQVQKELDEDEDD